MPLPIRCLSLFVNHIRIRVYNNVGRRRNGRFIKTVRVRIACPVIQYVDETHSFGI